MEVDSEEELGLDLIKRKKIYPQCIIDSDSNSEGENNEAKIREPQTVDLTDSINNPESYPEIGGDMSDMIQNLMQTRPSETSTLQCSECDLQCPSLQAYEFHTKLHVMERIVQSSYKYPELGLKRSKDNVNKQKSNSSKNSITKKNIINQQSSSKENIHTNIDEARDIETMIESLVSEGANKEISHSVSGSDYSDEKPLKCKKCSRRFKTKKGLNRHRRTHSVEKTYACTECDYTCLRRNTFNVHKRTKHGTHKIPKRSNINSEKKPFNCTECDSRFKTKYYLEAHMLKHLPATSTQNPKSINMNIKVPKCINITSTDKKPFKCNKCDSRFKTKQYYEGHMLTHLTQKCTLCEYRCSKKGLLTRHMLIHTGTKHHECPVCDYKCFEKGNLAKHMVIHGDDRPFSCPEEGCDYKCKLKSNLKNHMLKHSCEKPYACHLCDYRSLAKGSLTYHMFKHSGVKPFPCSVCGNRFAVKGELNIHMRFHTNNKNFKCQLCDYRSFTQGRVNQHMLSHTGEKPHKCEECGSRFTKTMSLKKHMRSRHGIFGNKNVKCHLCNYSCFTQHHLDRHMSTHTGEKSIKCDECGSQFTSISNLKNHLQTHGIYDSIPAGSSQMPKDSPYHSEVSNASSVNEAHQTIHQGNIQPLNNQHIIDTSSTMGRTDQETTYPNVNYNMFSNNMDYHSFSKIYSNFPPTTKPIWPQGSSRTTAVNTAVENLGNISQNYAHNPLAPYSHPMFPNSLDLTPLNSKIPSRMPVPPNMPERIQHTNYMHNIQ